MDLDALLKLLQSWTNSVPLIILGSGASVPFRLPSMWTLGDHIKNNISFADTDDQLQFENFKTAFDTNGDLEATLSKLQLRPKVLDQIVFKTWELVNQADIQAYESFINKTNSFPFSELTKHLLSTAGKKLSVVTTNYDRLAEYAASLAEATICTGYSQNFIGHFSSNIHKNNLTKLQGYNGQVNIWKVHGSLDWFKTKNEENIQLPLRHTIPSDCKPSIVTPGLSKYYETHNEPYRTIFTQADSEIEAANGFLCIGYGFNDEHVQPKLINQIKSRHKPIIVITKELTPKTKQSIIDNNCKNYILMEEKNGTDTQVYSSSLGEHLVPNVSYWSLPEFLKLIIT
jgi:NAD-dependent SIR2 family protein deacetylase